MKCPACGERMHAQSLDSITVDTCPGCRGTWFDSAELDAAVARLEPSHSPVEASVPVRGHSPFSCARCFPARMESVGWPTLRLDRCPDCRGFFLDNHELEDLVARRSELEVRDFESRIYTFAVSAGTNALAASGLIKILIRLLAAKLGR